LSGGATRQPDSLRSTGQRLKPFDVGNTIRYLKPVRGKINDTCTLSAIKIFIYVTARSYLYNNYYKFIINY
ncbi:hypothetical protein SAMN02744102_04552, partial [Paenibacillus barengoltzii]